jgi:uncharacterized protein (TIRG00374 family)
MTPEPPSPPARVRSGRRRLLDVLSLVVVVAVFGFVLPRIIDYREVGSVLAGLGAVAIVALLALAVWNLVTYWLLTTAVLPHLSLRHAAAANLASTAVSNTMPAGAALGIGLTWRMFASWGVSAEQFALYSLVSGVWNQFVKLGMPLLALGLLALSGGAAAGLVTAAVIGGAVLAAALVAFGLVLRGDDLAARVGRLLQRALAGPARLFHRPPPTRIAAGLVAFRADAAGTLQRRGLWITVTTVVSHLTLWLTLLACLRACGIGEDEVSWQRTLAAFAFVRLLTALPITPGGLGVVELGLTGALAAGLAGDGASRVAAAVLLFRALTYALPIPLGFLALVWWRADAARRRPGVVRVGA